jgi:hypothetical protein
MRFRVGILLCLFAIFLAVGCRKTLAPNVDRNLAPETWITGAPMDTITIDRNGNEPVPVRIPIRFHLHWAGADQDGAIAGFYYAVVETLPVPDPISNRIPDLPGPKPRDYHFIAKTDSIFIFNVAENIPSRQHAFYIFAVDNLGKPDPTPARFVFTASDRFPPLPVFDVARATGTIYVLNPGTGTVSPQTFVRNITDSLISGEQSFIPPRDTVPSNPEVYFQWHGEPRIAGSVITGYRYKLDEPQFVTVDSSVHSVTYGPEPTRRIVAPGQSVFLLRAVDQASGTEEKNRRFQVNFSPDTWFAGPDPAQCAQCATKPNGERYLLVRDIGAGVNGSLLSADSVRILPALRKQIKTFFEVYKDTIYLRSEDDTLHMNSIAIFHSGGLDKDSKYAVKVSPLSPNLPVGPVTTPGPPNGSPIAFRNLPVIRLSPTNRISQPLKSPPYPLFDPNSIDNNPRIGGYNVMNQSGRIYYVVQAVDGDNESDKRIEDPRQLVEKIEGGTATSYEQSLRSRVMTFQVNKSPYFLTSNSLFAPTPGQTFTTNQWHMEIYADDEDPYAQAITPGGPPPVTQPKTLRFRIRLLGLKTNGDSLRYSDGLTYDAGQSPIAEFFIPPAENLAAGPALVVIELCDCFSCENANGGRCITYQIPVNYQPTNPQSLLRRPIPSSILYRPGTGGTASRRQP